MSETGKVDGKGAPKGCDLNDLRHCEPTSLNEPVVLSPDVLQNLSTATTSRYQIQDGKVVPIPQDPATPRPLFYPLALHNYQRLSKLLASEDQQVRDFLKNFPLLEETQRQVRETLQNPSQVADLVEAEGRLDLLEGYAALLETETPPNTIVWGEWKAPPRSLKLPDPQNYEELAETVYGHLAVTGLESNEAPPAAPDPKTPSLQARRQILESAQRIVIAGAIEKRLTPAPDEREGKVSTAKLAEMQRAVEEGLSLVVYRAERELPAWFRADVVRQARDRLEALQKIILYGDSMEKTSYGVDTLRQAAGALVDDEGALLRYALVRDWESLIPRSNDPDRPLLEGRLDFLTRTINHDETDKVVGITAGILEETDRFALGHAIDDDIQLISGSMEIVRKADRDSRLSGLTTLSPLYYEDGLKWLQKIKRLYEGGQSDEAGRQLSELTMSRFYKDLIGYLELAQAWDESKALVRTAAIVVLSGQVSSLAGLSWQGIVDTTLGKVGVSLGVAATFWAADRTLSAATGEPFFQRGGVADRVQEAGLGIASTWGMFAAIGGGGRVTQWLTEIARMSPEGRQLAMLVGEYTGFTGWEFVEGNARLAIEDFRFEPAKVADTVFSWKAARHRAVFLAALKLGNHLASPLVNPVAQRLQLRAMNRTLRRDLRTLEARRDGLLRLLGAIDPSDATRMKQVEPIFKHLLSLARGRLALLQALRTNLPKNARPDEAKALDDAIAAEEQAVKNAEQFYSAVGALPSEVPTAEPPPPAAATPGDRPPQPDHRPEPDEGLPPEYLDRRGTHWAAETEWTVAQKRGLTAKVLSSGIGIGYDHYCEELVDFLSQLRSAGWSSAERYRIALLVAGMPLLPAMGALYGLPKLIPVMANAGWNRDQQLEFLSVLLPTIDPQRKSSPTMDAEKFQRIYLELAHLIPSLTQMGLDGRQLYDLLLSLTQKTGEQARSYYRMLMESYLHFHQCLSLSPEGAQAFFENLVEKYGVTDALEVINRLRSFLDPSFTPQRNQARLELFLRLLDQVAAPHRHQLLTLLGEWQDRNHALTTPDRFQFCFGLCRTIVERYGKSAQEVWYVVQQFFSSDPHQDPERADLFLRLVDHLTDYNRKQVLELLLKNSQRLSSLSADDFRTHFGLYNTIFERWPRLGFPILEGLLETEQAGDIPDLAGEGDRILRFIEVTHGFIPAFYRAYRREGEAALRRLQGYAQAILKDELDPAGIERIITENAAYGGKEFLLAVIQSASPTSGASFVKKTEQLGLMEKMLAAGDLRGHIPEAWRNKSKEFEVDQGEWRPRSGETIDPDGKVRDLLNAFRVGEGQKIAEDQLEEAVEEYLKSDRGEEAREKIRGVLFAYAGSQDALREKIDRIQDRDYTALALLEQLFHDKDALPSLLRETLSKVPADLFAGRGRKRSLGNNPTRFVKAIQQAWQGRPDPAERKEILSQMLWNYDPDEVASKILSRRDVQAIPGLVDAIREVTREAPAPDLSPLEVENEILSGPLAVVRGEKVKFAYRGREPLRMSLRPVKGPTYGMNGLTSGVCTATDIELWKNPAFKLLAVVDQNSNHVVGYLHVFETVIDGKRYITLPGINPSAEFLSTVDARKFYAGMMAQVIAFAQEGGYSGVYIPASKGIHSNRSEIQEVIKKSHYREKDIPTVRWNTKPNPYPFSKVLVVWEEQKEPPTPPREFLHADQRRFLEGVAKDRDVPQRTVLAQALASHDPVALLRALDELKGVEILTRNEQQTGRFRRGPIQQTRPFQEILDDLYLRILNGIEEGTIRNISREELDRTVERAGGEPRRAALAEAADRHRFEQRLRAFGVPNPHDLEGSLRYLLDHPTYAPLNLDGPGDVQEVRTSGEYENLVLNLVQMIQGGRGRPPIDPSQRLPLRPGIGLLLLQHGRDSHGVPIRFLKTSQFIDRLPGHAKLHYNPSDPVGMLKGLIYNDGIVAEVRNHADLAPLYADAARELTERILQMRAAGLITDGELGPLPLRTIERGRWPSILARELRRILDRPGMEAKIEEIIGEWQDLDEEPTLDDRQTPRPAGERGTRYFVYDRLGRGGGTLQSVSRDTGHTFVRAGGAVEPDGRREVEQRSWLYADGGLHGETEEAHVRGRFYFAVKPEHAAEFWNALRELFDRAERTGHRFQAKISQMPNRFESGDPAVLYFHARDQEFFYEEVVATCEKHPEWFHEDRRPVFAAQVRDEYGHDLAGVSFAQASPRSGTSANSLRADVLTTGLRNLRLLSLLGLRLSPDQVATLLADAIYRDTIDPDHPAFNRETAEQLGGAQTFRFILDHSDQGARRRRGGPAVPPIPFAPGPMGIAFGPLGQRLLGLLEGLSPNRSAPPVRSLFTPEQATYLGNLVHLYPTGGTDASKAKRQQALGRALDRSDPVELLKALAALPTIGVPRPVDPQQVRRRLAFQTNQPHRDDPTFREIVQLLAVEIRRRIEAGQIKNLDEEQLGRLARQAGTELPPPHRRRRPPPPPPPRRPKPEGAPADAVAPVVPAAPVAPVAPPAVPAAPATPATPAAEPPIPPAGNRDGIRDRGPSEGTIAFAEETVVPARHGRHGAGRNPDIIHEVTRTNGRTMLAKILATRHSDHPAFDDDPQAPKDTYCEWNVVMLQEGRDVAIRVADSRDPKATQVMKNPWGNGGMWIDLEVGVKHDHLSEGREVLFAGTLRVEEKGGDYTLILTNDSGAYGRQIPITPKRTDGAIRILSRRFGIHATKIRFVPHQR